MFEVDEVKENTQLTLSQCLLANAETELVGRLGG